MNITFDEEKRMRKQQQGTWILKKIATVCAAACLSVCLLAGCAGQKSGRHARTEDLPVLTVGCDAYAPFSYMDADGNLTGIDIELATEAFDRMGYHPEFKIISWEEKKQLLKEGVIDCIWSSFTMDGREEEYQWAGPYMESHQVVAVNPGSKIKSLQDLKDKVIAVQSSTKPEDIIRAHDGTLPQLHKVISVQQRELIFILLSKGCADALAAHDTSIEQFMKESGLQFRILDEPLQTVGLGVAFDKNDTRGISTELSKTLDEMRSDGTVRKVLQKYVKDANRYLGGSDGR